MAAVTINWTKVVVYIGMGVLCLFTGAVALVIAALAAVAAYAALCMGLKLAAGIIMGAGLMPMVALSVIAAAFWQDHRKQRLRSALGGPVL